MKFRVYNVMTDEDVTNKEAWVIDTEGDLRFVTFDHDTLDYRLELASGDYYYKLEIEVF